MSLLERDSWMALLNGLVAFSSIKLPGAIASRIEQLNGAIQSGIRTPRTIITTDPRAVVQDLASDQVVVKALDEHFVEASPGILTGVFPEILASNTADQWSSVGFPVIVQEYVEHDRELRVYSIDDALCAFDVRRSEIKSSWDDLAGSKVVSVDIPTPVAKAVRDLANRWHVVYGAFDFLLADDDPIFLEVNMDGDWLSFERAAGVSTITTEVAAFIYKHYNQICDDERRRPPVEPVNFLTHGVSIRDPAE